MANALDIRSRLSNSTALTMPAPAPVDEVPAQPKANALAVASPYARAPVKPQNELLGAAIKGFRRGFNPEGYEKEQERNKTAALEKAKQTLALMQQQRALPTEQRAQWWTQNAPQIGQIIGQDLTQQPVDPNAFTDQELDGQIAMLSGQLGIAPTQPEPMSEYQRAQIDLAKGKADDPRLFSTAKGIVSVGPDGKPELVYDTQPAQGRQDLPPGMMYDQDGKIVEVPGYVDMYRRMHPGEGSSAGRQPPVGYRWKQDGSLERIPGGPADKPSAPAYDAATARKYLAQAQTLDSLDGAINQYMDLIQKHGPQWQTTGLQGDNTIAAQLDAARTAIDIQTKELFNLGVLNGPDLDIIRGAIPDVTGFEALGKTGASVGASLNVLRDYISRGRNQIPPEIVARARPNGSAAPTVSKPAANGPKFPDGTPITSETLQQLPPGLREIYSRMLPREDDDAAMNAHIDSLFPVDDGGDQGPSVGQEEDGFRFLGGDPGDPNSWEPVQ